MPLHHSRRHCRSRLPKDSWLRDKGNLGLFVLSSALIFGPSDHFDCPQVQQLKVKVMKDIFKLDSDSGCLGQRLRGLSQVSQSLQHSMAHNRLKHELPANEKNCLHQMHSKPLSIQSHKSHIIERYSEKVDWAMLAVCLNNRGQTAALIARKRLHIGVDMLNSCAGLLQFHAARHSLCICDSFT